MEGEDKKKVGGEQHGFGFDLNLVMTITAGMGLTLSRALPALSMACISSLVSDRTNSNLYMWVKSGQQLQPKIREMRGWHASEFCLCKLG